MKKLWKLVVPVAIGAAVSTAVYYIHKNRDKVRNGRNKTLNSGNSQIGKECFEKKKILFLSNHFITLFLFRKELINRLIEAGHDIYISTPEDPDDKYFSDLGCKIIFTPMDRRGVNPKNDLKTIVAYRKIMKEVQPDIIFSYTIKPNIYGGFVSSMRGIPFVANITGLGTTVENKGPLQVLTLNMYKVALRKAQTVFFQNAANEEFFQSKGIAIGKHKLLPGSGVNLTYHEYKEPHQTAQGHESFLFVGRVMKDKGVDELLQAAERIKKDYPDTEFKIVGFMDEDYAQTLKQAQENGIIKYMGRQADVRPFYEKCDAVILPSYHEGMANVLLEAAATGRPVLASDIPGCRETFDEGISGIGFEPKNADSLYHAILRFLELSSDARAQMGRKGREKMEREFSRDIIINEYMKELHKVK